MKASQVWAEMARRKILFHKNEEWDKIHLWGLFDTKDIRTQLDKRELIISGGGHGGPVWVVPSEQAYNNNIKPLIDKYTLSELLDMAGW